MKLFNTIAAIAIGLAATSIGSAQASTIDVDFSGGGVTADLVLNVVGGQAISGTGVLTDSAISATAMSMSLVTLSTPTVSNLGGGGLSYRFGGGTDLIGDTSVPIDGDGLVFKVATPSSPALQLGANLWSNGGSSYTLFLAGNSLTGNGPIVYDPINGTASVSAVPVPAALPLFGSAVFGIAVAARRRVKKMQPTTA
jgi:hypothetical protein